MMTEVIYNVYNFPCQFRHLTMKCQPNEHWTWNQKHEPMKWWRLDKVKYSTIKLLVIVQFQYLLGEASSVIIFICHNLWCDLWEWERMQKRVHILLKTVKKKRNRKTTNTNLLMLKSINNNHSFFRERNNFLMILEWSYGRMIRYRFNVILFMILCRAFFSFSHCELRQCNQMDFNFQCTHIQLNIFRDAMYEDIVDGDNNDKYIH